MVGRVALVGFVMAIALIGRVGQAVAEPARSGIEAAPRGMQADDGLSLDAPANCPDVGALRERVERRLGHALEDSAGGIAISIERDRGRFVAHVDLRALTVANDVRTLTSRRCDELADAIAVVVARVARDARVRERARDAVRDGHGRAARDDRDTAPDGETARADREAARADRELAERDNADAPIPPPRPRPTRAANATHAATALGAPRIATADDAADTATTALHLGVTAPPHRVWSIGARLSGVSGIGIVPRVGLGAELAITLRHDSTLAEIAETRWMKSGAQLHAGGPAHVDVDLSVTALRAGWRSEQLPLRGWFSVEGGSMRGSGVSLDNPSVGSGRWLAAGAGFGVAWQMTPWIRLVGSTEALVAFERVRFSLGDGAVVYAPSPLSVRTTCGLELGWQ